MLDIHSIRQNPEEIKKGIAAKNGDVSLVDAFLAEDKRWRELTKGVDELRGRQKKAGNERNVIEATRLKEEIKAQEEGLTSAEKKREELLRKMPNPPLPEVPIGKSDKENVVLREVGEKPAFDFMPKDYLALAEGFDIIDTERAAK